MSRQYLQALALLGFPFAPPAADATPVRRYRYVTSSDAGTIAAASYSEACRSFALMFDARSLAAGAWGWIEDVDGYRYQIGAREAS